MKYKDMTGQKFSHLFVICRHSKTNAKRQAFWLCRCDCGQFLVVRGDNLRSGTSTRCSECTGHPGKSSIYVKEVIEDGVV